MSTRYREYVDSGAKWLGQLPAHWRLAPLGTHFDERSQIVSDTEFAPLSVTKDGVVPQMETVAKTDKNDTRKLVRAGDFAINSRSDRKGSSGVSDRDGSVSLVYTVLTPRAGIDSRFLHHLLRSGAFQEEFYRWGNGIVADLWSTRYSSMKRIPLALPPMEEQRAIADFLDRETAKVDGLIGEQEGLVEVLRERRSAVITRAATRGVDGAPLVAVGDPHLAAVPGHWRMSRFGREMLVNAGQVDPREEPWVDMILVAPNHIQSGTGRIIGRQTAREQGADSGKYVVQAGQVLYSKIRPALNKVTVAVEDCLCSADMYALSSRTPGDARFAMYFMLARPFHTYATLQSLRVKMPKVNREELGAAPWVVPPIEEQSKIANYLDEQTAKIDALIAEAEGIVAVAKERRSALITAAVTGQFDVRGEVA